MPTFPAPVAAASLSVLLLAATLSAQTTDQPASPASTSKIRIVRLSEVKGEVQLDRNIGRDFEPAITNMPIVEDSRLQTATGVAEVEFEDNSTLRLAPDSLVEFTRLDRLASGATGSTIHLLKGTAYISLVKSKPNEFTLSVGEQEIQVPPGTHLRVRLQGTEATIAVLDGTLHLDAPSGAMEVPHKKTVTLDMLHEDAQPTLAKDIAPETFDAWDKSASEYHARTASMSAFGNSPYSYGLNDMMYYGSFSNVGGCGSMWRPYFASAAWDPYSNGSMAYYSGAGYSWVSPYPWGWTPYHSGSWSYCNGAGWGWQPGGTWNGLNNVASITSPGGGSSPYRRLPVSPTQPPKTGQPSMLAVNSKPLVRSEAGSPESFVFRKDSAGLGIPRSSLGKLNGLSQQAISRGTVTTPIYVNSPASLGANGRGPNASSTSVAATSVRRGSPPPSAGNMSSPGGMSPNSGMARSMPSSAGSRPMTSSPGPAPSSGGHNH